MTATTTIISSQRYLDDEIVEEKRTGEYTIYVSPQFAVDGEIYQVLLDGHHSLAAAKLDGVDPEVVELDEYHARSIALLDKDGGEELFLEAAYIDSDYYDIETGIAVW